MPLLSRFPPPPAACLGLVLVAALAAAAPSIEIEPEVLDFGERGHMEYPTLPLLIRNTGDEDLAIHEIYSSCDCTKWTLVRGTKQIPPGGETELRIRLSTGRLVGELHKYVRIASDDPRRGQVRVPVRAAVHARIAMAPRFLDTFYGAKEGSPVTQVVELSYRVPAAKPMRLEKIRPSTPHFAVRPVPLAGARKGQGYRLYVSLLPSAPEGRITGQIVGVLDGRKWVMNVHGEMFRGIRVRPNFLNFNRIDDPARAEARFRLEATDGFPFEITEIRSDPAWLRFEVRASDSATKYEVIARVATEERPKRFFGKVRAATTHPQKPEIEISFSGFFPARKETERPGPREGAGGAGQPETGGRPAPGAGAGAPQESGEGS